MLVQQIETALQAGQHAESQHVDLEDAERVEIVLVPFDAGALRHGGVLDRDDVVEPATGNDEAAHMLREMARKADQFMCQRQHLGEVGIGRIETGAARVLFGDALVRPSPHHASERAHGVVRQPERLADFPDGTAGAVADHGGGKAGAMTAVAAIDVLDDLLAALMLEIDVDVGRFAPLHRDEALEQEIDPLGIDLGDAETETDRRIGCRAAPLAQDAARAGIAHNVVDGEEIGRVLEFSHEGKLVVEGGTHFRWHAMRIAPPRAVLRVGNERILGRGEAFMGLVGIFVVEFIQRKPAASEKAQRLRDGFRRVAEQPRHFARRLEVALRIGFEPASRGREGEVLANAGRDVLQGTPLGRVIEHIADRDQRHPRVARDSGEAREAAGVVATVEHAGAEPHRTRRGVAEMKQEGCQFPVGVGRLPQAPRQHNEIEPRDMRHEIVAMEQAPALFGAAFTEREKPREPSPGGAVLRIGEDVGRAVGEHEPGPGRKAKPRILRGLMGPHDAGDRVAVRDAEARKAKLLGVRYQFLAMGSPAQEREVGDDGKLGILGGRRL